MDMQSRLDKIDNNGDAKQSCVKAVEWLKALTTQQVDQFVFRFKPRFQHPHEDQTRAWTWLMTFSIRCDPMFIEAWFTLAAQMDVEGVSVRPAKSHDGTITKKLRDFVKASSASAMVYEGDEDDDMEIENKGAKRGKKGGA